MHRPFTQILTTHDILLIVLPTALILLIPLIATHYSTAFDWKPEDFLVAGVLIGGSLTVYRWLAGRLRNRMLKVAWMLFIFTTLLLIWVNLAVGIVGNEGEPANLLFYLLPLLGSIFAARVRFRPAEMARILRLMGIIQVMLGGMFYILSPQITSHGSPGHILLLSLFFATGWFGSAFFFHRGTNRIG
ncbi:MAG: hypothetical protein Kow0037_25380 [Calditrichia bacterium]